MSRKQWVPRERKDTYVFDPENVAEMARLELQDRLITEGMGGILPEWANRLPEGTSRVLDLACGPGDWTRLVASKHPHVEVVGIDISEIMIAYAQIKTQEAGLKNIQFRTGNILEPINYPDHSFDLVEARFVGAVLLRERWAGFLAECVRLTKPGGNVRLTEVNDFGITNSEAQRQMTLWGTKTLHMGGYGISTVEDSYIITPYLEDLLHEAGCDETHSYSYTLDYSYGTKLYATQCRNYLILIEQLKGICVRLGITTEQEFQATYENMKADFASENFKGDWLVLTASGRKPL